MAEEGLVPGVQGELFYRFDGPKDAPLCCVLLHGFAMDSSEFDGFVAAAQRFPLRILRFDMPGHGRSRIAGPPVPPFTRAFLVENVAQALAALTAQGLLPAQPRLAFVGHSMGGMVAGAFAVAHPQMVCKLVLLAPAGLVLAEPFSAKLAKIPGLGALLRATFGARALEHIHDDEFKDDEDAKRHLQELVRRMLAETPLFQETAISIANHLGINGGMIDGFRELGASHKDLPVLVLWGDLDVKCPFATAEPLLREAVPHASYVVLHGCSHQILHSASSQEAEQHILNFLTQQ